MIAALDQLEINDKDIKQAVDEIERVFDKSSKWVKKEFPCPL